MCDGESGFLGVHNRTVLRHHLNQPPLSDTENTRASFSVSLESPHLDTARALKVAICKSKAHLQETLIFI